MVRHGSRFLALVLLGLAAGSGCVSLPNARYVYQDGQHGVIGIPRNTPLGKKDYRAQAHELMIRHFPEGYEIVRAEEVVEGERTLDTAIKKELETEPGFSALNQALRVGKIAASSSLDQKDIVHITESRIIYKRREAAATAGHDGFTALATVSPDLYLDPNDAARKLARETTMLVKKEIKAEAKQDDKDRNLADAKTRDDSIRKASGPEH